MSNAYFKFKQFTVFHDRCAMKVGTDGVLLGAWAPLEGCRRVLDVGTGTGLIALQIAQRAPEVMVTAVEVDEAAAQQAAENVAASPWADKVAVVCADFRQYVSVERFDLIVSNPPYFVDALKCPDRQRNAARHAGGLNYDLLFRSAAQLLQDRGGVALIVPAEAEAHVGECAGVHGFFLCRLMRVYTKPGKPCRRLLMLFRQLPSPCIEESLCLADEENRRSAAYTALTQDFYL
ncbi:MAG: methyltransferase [Bacteroides sp.]|nr:methyltransferase [Bacteroides sp.]